MQGRAEFIEKYAMEVVGELLSRGLAVYAVDLRGQGLSERLLPDHDKGHIDDFTTYVRDLKSFLEAVVGSAAPRPILAMGHSTGGNIVLRYLAEWGASPFVAAAFTSPMTGLPRALLLHAVLAVASPLGLFDKSYMPGTGPFDPASRDFTTNDVTNDKRRYLFTDQWFQADPRLKLGGPTRGWVRQALCSIGALNAPGVLERLGLPVLIASASDDRVVDTGSHVDAVRRIPGARHIVVDGAKHEILMETDPRRAQFWAAFDGFVATLAGR